MACSDSGAGGKWEYQGLVWSNRHRRTLLDKLVAIFLPIVKPIDRNASRKVTLPLFEAGHNLVTRTRTTTVAYLGGGTGSEGGVPDKRGSWERQAAQLRVRRGEREGHRAFTAQPGRRGSVRECSLALERTSRSGGSRS
jgi:hypothetical protein